MDLATLCSGRDRLVYQGVTQEIAISVRFRLFNVLSETEDAIIIQCVWRQAEGDQRSGPPNALIVTGSVHRLASSSLNVRTASFGKQDGNILSPSLLLNHPISSIVRIHLRNWLAKSSTRTWWLASVRQAAILANNFAARSRGGVEAQTKRAM